VQNDLIDRLTVRTFNEELKSVFPYIYKFVDESELPVVELGADDLISEEPAVEKQVTIKTAKTMDPEMAFEAFLDDIVSEDKNEVISSNNDAQSAAIEKLNAILAQNMQVGPNGDNAIMTLKGLIDEPNFIDAVKSVPAETDLNDIIKGWIETEHEDLLSRLQFPEDSETPAPAEPTPAPAAPETPAAPEAAAPAEPAPTAPAQPAPVAENKKSEDDSPPWDVDPKEKKSKPVTPGKHGQGYSQARHLARQGMANAMKNAVKAGATLETQLNLDGQVKTIAEIIDECGMSPQDVGLEAPHQEDGLQGMLKYISGFYNKDEGNFPLGGMRVKIKVKKAFEDGEFGGASQDDLIKVIKFIDAKDPSGNEHNQITRLAGIQKPQHAPEQKGFDISALETQLQSISESPTINYAEDQSLASIIHLAGLVK
jgi:hypothetical protein